MPAPLSGSSHTLRTTISAGLMRDEHWEERVKRVQRRTTNVGGLKVVDKAIPPTASTHKRKRTRNVHA